MLVCRTQVHIYIYIYIHRHIFLIFLIPLLLSFSGEREAQTTKALAVAYNFSLQGQCLSNVHPSKVKRHPWMPDKIITEISTPKSLHMSNEMQHQFHCYSYESDSPLLFFTANSRCFNIVLLSLGGAARTSKGTYAVLFFFMRTSSPVLPSPPYKCLWPRAFSAAIRPFCLFLAHRT